MPPIENKFTAPVKWAKMWNELGEIDGYYVDVPSGIDNIGISTFATKEQAIQYGIVAAQLSQLVANLNGEPNWKPQKYEECYCIDAHRDGKLQISVYLIFVSSFPLKTKEAAEFSLKHHADLWRKFHGLI